MLNRYLICAFCILFITANVSASTEVELIVTGCNNNNICEFTIGENTANCSNDCTLCNNNNICELLKGESTASCPTDCPATVVPIPVGQSSGGYAGSQYNAIEIKNVKVVTSNDVAIISWYTPVASFGLVQWGTSIDYSLGSIDKVGISSTHSVRFEKMISGETYYFQISASLPGVKPSFFTGYFTMPNAGDVTPPANISHLIASPEAEDIVLTWQNPSDKDFAGVKILRSPYFFPKNIDDGKLVYDGAGTYARDVNVKLNQVYYYTAFSYDLSHNYSSGTLVRISRNLPSTETIAFSDNKKLTLEDFSFIQNNIALPVSGNTVRIYPFYDTDISIEANKVSLNVQYLIIGITDPLDETNTFLYKMSNEDDKQYFRARMSVMSESGKYPFSIDLVSKNNQNIGKIEGVLDVNSVKTGFDTRIIWQYILIIVIILILVIAGRKKKRSNSKTNS